MGGGGGGGGEWGGEGSQNLSALLATCMGLWGRGGGVDVGGGGEWGRGVGVGEGDDGGIAQSLHAAITHLIRGEAGDVVSPLPPQHSHNPASWQSCVTACVFFRLLAVIFFCKMNEKI